MVRAESLMQLLMVYYICHCVEKYFPSKGLVGREGLVGEQFQPRIESCRIMGGLANKKFKMGGGGFILERGMRDCKF